MSFEDPYTLAPIPKKYLVHVGKQPYNMRSLMRAAHRHPTREGRYASPKYLNMYRQPLPKDVVDKLKQTLPRQGVPKWETYVLQLAAIVVSTPTATSIVRVKKILQRLQQMIRDSGAGLRYDKKYREEMMDYYLLMEKSVVVAALYMYVSSDRWDRSQATTQVRFSILQLLIQYIPSILAARHTVYPHFYLILLVLAEQYDLNKPAFNGQRRNRHVVYNRMYKCIQYLTNTWNMRTPKTSKGSYGIPGDLTAHTSYHQKSLVTLVINILKCNHPRSRQKDILIKTIVDRYNRTFPRDTYRLPYTIGKEKCKDRYGRDTTYIRIPDHAVVYITANGTTWAEMKIIPKRNRSRIKMTYGDFTGLTSKSKQIRQEMARRKRTGYSI